MPVDKHLLNKFMDQFGAIKLAYWISVSKQNKIIRLFIDRVRQSNDGFMVNDAVLAELLAVMPRQFRLSAKEGLNARTKDACQNIFADQMDILYHGVKHGWDSCGDYPYSHHEMIIFASECMTAEIEAIELQMLAASFKKPNKLAEACEQILDRKTIGHAKSICDFYSNCDPEYATNVLHLQKNLFCDTLKRTWNQTFLLNSLNMGEHDNKGGERISLLLSSKRKARAKHYSKEAMLLKSAQEQSDRDAETFFQGLESEADDLEQKEDVAAGSPTAIDHLSLQLCAVEDIKKVLQDNKKLKPSYQSSLKDLLKNNGCIRLIPIPEAYRNILSRFRVRFPHIHLLADEIEANLSLFSLGGGGMPLKLLSQICILDGAPGVGKTVAVEFLAKEFGTAFRVIDCAGQSNGFDIIGQSSGWTSGKAGHVADMLIGQKSPNAIMILDEVDKMKSSDVSPLENALYSLLEPESAKRFRDEFYDFEMDASQINWLATSNDYENIPAPIRDRAKRIIITMPDAAQRKTIASYLYQDDRSEHEAIWGKYFSTELSDDIAEYIAMQRGISIRGMKQIIHGCFSILSMQADEGDACPLQSLIITEAAAEKSTQAYLKHNGPDAVQSHNYQSTKAGFIRSVSGKEIS